MSAPGPNASPACDRYGVAIEPGSVCAECAAESPPPVESISGFTLHPCSIEWTVTVQAPGPCLGSRRKVTVPWAEFSKGPWAGYVNCPECGMRVHAAGEVERDIILVDPIRIRSSLESGALSIPRSAFILGPPTVTIGAHGPAVSSFVMPMMPVYAPEVSS